MRIGVDARELAGRTTGVGRYLMGLLNEWGRSDRARRHDFVLYASEPLAVALDAHRFPTHVISGPGGTWWEQVRLPALAARDRVDVLFSPGYTAPLFRRTPSVVAIHDISFAAHPEWFTAREGFRRRSLSRLAARQARSVITISRFSRQELIDRFGVAEHRLHVIPPGITAPATAASGVAAPTVPRLLFVGSIFNRRHVPDLIRAFRPIAQARPDAALDIVGDNRSYPVQDIGALISSLGLDGCVRWRAYVTDEELGTMYAQATAFAFLSEYEGLGLTPLEALAAGVPPVLLDTPVARESCEDAALYVPPGELESTTRALETLLFDPGARQRVLAAAPRVLAKYNWPRAARDTLAVIESAA